VDGDLIRERRVSSVTLLRRLGVHSRKNRLYQAFRELGRVVRTITLLRYLSDTDMREQITAVTSKTEAYHGFSERLRFSGEIIGRNDPDCQEKIVKFNELLANFVIYQNACGITAAANALAADGHPVDPDDLATIAPYITHTIRRFGDWILDLFPPEAAQQIGQPPGGVQIAGRGSSLAAMAENFDPVAHNRAAWDRAVDEADEWTRPVGPDVVARARAGDRSVVLIGYKPAPATGSPPT
jgi:Tn3 transposase DDE domain